VSSRCHPILRNGGARADRDRRYALALLPLPPRILPRGYASVKVLAVDTRRRPALPRIGLKKEESKKKGERNSRKRLLNIRVVGASARDAFLLHRDERDDLELLMRRYNLRRVTLFRSCFMNERSSSFDLIPFVCPGPLWHPRYPLVVLVRSLEIDVFFFLPSPVDITAIMHIADFPEITDRVILREPDLRARSQLYICYYLAREEKSDAEGLFVPSRGARDKGVSRIAREREKGRAWSVVGYGQRVQVVGKCKQ